MDNERLDVVLTCILRCAQDAARAWIFDSSLREDVAQEVGIRFIRYWRTSARNEDKDRFAYRVEYDQRWQCDEQQCRSWVQLPVRQVFISRWRHKSVGDQFVENVKNGYHSNPIAIIEDDHETTEDIARLYEHIAQLPPAQREILDLLLDGETAFEIASTLKISSNAVSCRYCRAVRTLRDCFKHTSP